MVPIRKSSETDPGAVMPDDGGEVPLVVVVLVLAMEVSAADEPDVLVVDLAAIEIVLLIVTEMINADEIRSFFQELEKLKLHYTD